MKTLTAIATAVETLTADGHLPEPGSVVITPDSAMIFPELSGAPISGLLVWAMHLEGPVTYQAENIFTHPDTVTGVFAHGKLDGIDVTIAATTYRAMKEISGHPAMRKVSVDEMALRELASNEEVLGKLQ